MSGIGGTSPGGNTRLRLGIMLALTTALVVIGGLRFARMDVLGTSFFASDTYYTRTTDGGKHLEHLNIDIVQYLSMVEDHRGVTHAFERQVPYPEFVRTGGPASEGGPVEGPVAPFIYRPFLPWVASVLPFDSADSFALVNLVCVVAGLWFLVDALYLSGRSPRAQLLGGALYVFALPVLVFTSSLYIDGGAMAFLVVGYWLMKRRWWWVLVAFLPLSYFVKESLLALAPAAAWAWRTTGHRFRDARFAAGAVITVAGWYAASKVARLWAPDPVYSYNVLPKLSYLGGNLGNLKSMLFFLLGTVPVLILALLAMWRIVRSDGARGLVDAPWGADVVGLAVLVLVNAYSMVSTDLTLRTGWLIYPFAIALSALWLDQVVGDEQAPSWTAALARRPAASPA